MATASRKLDTVARGTYESQVVRVCREGWSSRVPTSELQTRLVEFACSESASRYAILQRSYISGLWVTIYDLPCTQETKISLSNKAALSTPTVTGARPGARDGAQ